MLVYTANPSMMCLFFCFSHLALLALGKKGCLNQVKTSIFMIIAKSTDLGICQLTLFPQALLLLRRGEVTIMLTYHYPKSPGFPGHLLPIQCNSFPVLDPFFCWVRLKFYHCFPDVVFLTLGLEKTLQTTIETVDRGHP